MNLVHAVATSVRSSFGPDTFERRTSVLLHHMKHMAVI